MVVTLTGISIIWLAKHLGSIEGQVVYRPLAEAATQAPRNLSIPGLKLSLGDRNQHHWDSTTDESGGFRFKNVPFGTYKLEFIGPGKKRFSAPLSVSIKRPVSATALRIIEVPDAEKTGAKLWIIPIPKPELRRQLLDMVAEDQEIRRKWIAADASKPHPEMMAAMTKLNVNQVARLKNWTNQYGWLNSTLVGEDGSNAAFILIQHAAPKTQIAWYPLIESAFKKNQFLREDFAMFTDRVLLAKGKKQRFGTVALPIDKWTHGIPVFEPIEDEEKLNERRASVGLMLFADYIELLKKMYQPPK